MADDERDPPIEPQNYLSGVTVIDFGDIRVARGLTRRAHSGCPHNHMVYDKQERRLWCRDCERDVEAFDALLALIEPYDRALKELKRGQQELSEAQGFQVRSIAAKKLDEAWRRHSMVPACPHCGNGLFPEHFKTHVGLVGRDYAEGRLKASGKWKD